ncbi:MAG TPA: long-chain fatty acid--CoA ligase [Longimicrobiales bacterium]|nr:long-chain fatty acid--CoA ligase [Longimicrobiales bacterium]
MTTETTTRRYVANPAQVGSGTLVQIFFGSIEKYDRPDAQRVRTASGWRAISHGELLANVQACADGLQALGLGRGERVALLSENRPEWAQTDYALLCGGMLNVPLYPTLPANQLAFILNDSGARAVFVSNLEMLEKIRVCRADTATLEHVIVFDPISDLRAGELSWEQLLERGRAQPSPGGTAGFRERALRAQPDDVATIIYTSGTTGSPKGVVLTHNNIYTNVVAQNWMKPDDSDEATVSFLPLSHVFQRMVDYCLYWLGFSIAYSTIDNAVASLGEIKPTIVVAVPRVYEKVYERVLTATGAKRRLVLWARNVALAWTDTVLNGRKPGPRLRLHHAIADRLVFSKLRKRLGGRLRFFVSGGAPLSVPIAKFFYGAGVLILEGYGLTETSPVLAVNIPEAMRMGTVGRPIAGTELAIADDGEILARGPQIMQGYYKNPDATREVIDAEGWFHTGDIGDIDNDGFLRITDRKKELIVTAGGKNIAPQPIQNLAKQSRYVGEAVLIGDKRPFPILLIVPAFDLLERWGRSRQLRWDTRADLVALPEVEALYQEEVMRKLEGLARYESPKKIVLLEREFDLNAGEITPKLSVRRRVVEEHFRAQIESAYADKDIAAAG